MRTRTYEWQGDSVQKVTWKTRGSLKFESTIIKITASSRYYHLMIKYLAMLKVDSFVLKTSVGDTKYINRI